MISEADLKTTIYESFYFPLYLDVKENKKLIEKTVFLHMAYKGGNELVKLLNAHSVPEAQIPVNQLPLLKEKNWISEGSDFGTWIITLKGIWEAEVNSGVIDTEKLIDFINKKKLVSKAKPAKSLTEFEKIYLFTMIAMRSFSAKAIFSRQLDNHDDAVNAIEQSAEFLKQLKIIDENYELLGENSGENQLTHLLRAPSESLPSKIRFLYKRGAGRSGYLDVYDEETDTLSKDDIAYLLWRICERDLSFEEEDAIVNFCEKLLLEKIGSFYDRETTKDFPFTRSEHMFIIRDTLDIICTKKDLWMLSDK